MPDVLPELLQLVIHTIDCILPVNLPGGSVAVLASASLAPVSSSTRSRKTSISAAPSIRFGSDDIVECKKNTVVEAEGRAKVELYGKIESLYKYKYKQRPLRDIS